MGACQPPMSADLSSAIHVAIDLGASGGRVAIGRIQNGRLEVEVLHRFWNGGTKIRGALYWDVIGLWREILHGLKLAGIRAAETGARVSSIGVDSWAIDYALLDEHDALIDGVHCYRDARTDGVMQRVLEQMPKAELYAITGLQFLPFNTVYQLLATPRDHLERTRTLLLVPDLLHFWLTGRKACERTNASTTQFYDANTRGWATALLERLSLPHHFLPEIIDPGSILGPLEPKLARGLGLEGAVVVAVGTHDTASAVAAAPLTDANSAYISSGTWSLVGLETQRAIFNADSFEANLTNEAGIKRTNRLLKNVMGLWILQECRRSWGEPDWTTLYDEARVSNVTARIDPDDTRYLAPGLDMPERILEHVREGGQAIPESRGEIVRLVLESLAAKYALVLKELERASGVSVERIHIIGGGSQVTLLNQLTANATGCPVIAGPVDATLIGNLLVQLEAMQVIAPNSGRDLVRDSISLETYRPSVIQTEVIA
jgi:rhamnulokinase